MAPGGRGPGRYGTLLVYDVHLDPTRPSQRITSAVVEFEFRSCRKAWEVPEVVAIAPASWTSSSPSTQDETRTVGGGLSVGAPDAVANVGGELKFEKTAQRQTSDAAQVVGSTWGDADHGKEFTARWRLMENETTKTGVPTFLRCAMVLARPSNAIFEAKITIKANLDWKSAAKEAFNFWGKNPVDDPVLFKPSLPPSTSRLLPNGFDVDNLDLVDIREVVQIRHSTPFAPDSSLLN